MPFSVSCLLMREIISRTMDLMCASDSGWNTMMSSIRFTNSGRNARFISSITRSFILSYDCSSDSWRKPGVVRLPMMLVPRFDVMIRMLFLKSTTCPSESLRRPSSSTCRSMLKTSGCAFSISSNSTTEYGRRRTFSVR